MSLKDCTMENGPIPPQNNKAEPDTRPKIPQGLQTTRYLFLASVILCIVSVFLGILFSIASVVCAIIALVKITKLASKSEGELQITVKRLRTVMLAGFALAMGALIMNIVNIVIMFPIVLEALTTGDYSALGISENLQGTLTPGETPNDGSSTWG